MDNFRAVALMTLSMATFAMGDAFVKVSSGHMSVAQVLIFMALPGVLLFSVVGHFAGQPAISRSFFDRPVMLRNAVEGFAAICMVSALSLAPLSLVIAILQAVPLLVTIGAAVILKENVGPRRWAAVLIGLVGVLIMLRPDTGQISSGAVFALGAVIGLAGRDLITRVTPMRIGTLQMAAWGSAALIPAGMLLLPFTGPHTLPGLSAWGIIALASGANAIGYYCITAAMRLGDVSFVTPFRYSRLIFALFIAAVFFNELPDALTLIGAAIVIGSGLFVMWRERKLKESYR